MYSFPVALQAGNTEDFNASNNRAEGSLLGELFDSAVEVFEKLVAIVASKSKKQSPVRCWLLQR